MKRPLSQTRSAIRAREYRKAHHFELRQKALDSLDQVAELSRNRRAANRVKELDEYRNQFRHPALSNRVKKEVLRHIAKGRDIGSIAVWMNQPVSFIQKVMAEL